MSQSTASGTSSRRHTREHDVSSNSSSTVRYVDSEWETKEALRQRELEEVRARAAQMEKTMRWWSDCTANWREKWSKVRNERNKAREEAKVLRVKLEIAMKDANSFKHDMQELEIQNEQLRKEMDKIHTILLKHAGQFDRQIISILESDPRLRDALGVDELLEVYKNVERSGSKGSSASQKDLFPQKASSEGSVAKLEGHNISRNRDIEEYVLQGAVPKHAVELYKEDSVCASDREATKSPKPIIESISPHDNMEKRRSTCDSKDEVLLAQKLSALHRRLEEATRTISAEREEKSSLHRGMEKLKTEILQLRERCEELEESKAEATRELFQLKDRFRCELSAAQADLIDETTSREGMDRRLSDLRTELERLQAENAAEWGKRERLETEKISLERENKQLRNELKDMQDRLESRRVRPVSASDTDVRQIQQELLDRNKELSDLKHVHAKLKKALAEKTTELSHATRRSEQYEAEVKRVRARVEELKKELAAAQDEVDIATNSVRRLQRVNEDLVEQLESANVELEHFKARLRNSIHSTSSLRHEADSGVEDMRELRSPPGVANVHRSTDIPRNLSDEGIENF